MQWLKDAHKCVIYGFIVAITFASGENKRMCLRWCEFGCFVHDAQRSFRCCFREMWEYDSLSYLILIARPGSWTNDLLVTCLPSPHSSQRLPAKRWEVKFTSTNTELPDDYTKVVTHFLCCYTHKTVRPVIARPNVQFSFSEVVLVLPASIWIFLQLKCVVLCMRFWFILGHLIYLHVV